MTSLARNAIEEFVTVIKADRPWTGIADFTPDELDRYTTRALGRLDLADVDRGDRTPPHGDPAREIDHLAEKRLDDARSATEDMPVEDDRDEDGGR